MPGVTNQPSRMSVTEMQTLLDMSDLVRFYGMKATHAFHGEATLVLPFREEFVRPGDAVNGPVFMAAADVAMWLALMTMVGREDSAVTIEMKTMFIRPARDRRDLHCTAKVLKLGRRVVFGTAECSDGAGTLYAHHTLTYARDPARASAQ